MDLVFAALALQEQIEKIGAYAGFAAIPALALLSLLVFSQARELRRLREWAGRAPERASELEERVAARAASTVRRSEPQAVGPAAPAVPAPGSPASAAARGAAPRAPKPQARPVAATAGAAAPAKAMATAGAPATAGASAASGAPAGAGAEAGAPRAPAGVGVKPGPGAATPGPAGQGAKAPTGAGSATGPPATGAPSPGQQSGGGTPAATAAGAGGAGAGAGGSVGGAGATVARPPVDPSASARRATAAFTPDRTTAAAQARARRLLDEPMDFGLDDDYDDRPRSRPVVFLAGGLALVAALVALVIVLGGGGESATEPTQGQQPPTGAAPGTPVVRGETTVAVLNGTTIPGLAAQVADEIERAGFKRGQVTNAADQQRAATTIYYAAGHLRTAQEVGSLLSVSQIAPIDPGTQAIAGPEANVVVTVGTDRAQ